MNRLTTTTLLGLCIAYWGLLPSAYAASAGKFLVVIGDVRIVDEDGKERRAKRGTQLNQGDTIKTANRSLAQVQMADRGRISVRADTEMRLSSFQYKGPSDSKGSMTLRLLRGAMRSITGLIGRFNRKGYKLKTPHATIGIRGTDHETTVLLKPRDGFQPGTFDQVYSGQTIMRTEAGLINVLPKQAAFVGAKVRKPRLVKIPKFLKKIHAAPTQPRTAKLDTGEAKGSAGGAKGSTRGAKGNTGGAKGNTGGKKKRPATPRAASKCGVLLNPLQSRSLSTKEGATETKLLTTSKTLLTPRSSSPTTKVAPSKSTTTKLKAVPRTNSKPALKPVAPTTRLKILTPASSLSAPKTQRPVAPKTQRPVAPKTQRPVAPKTQRPVAPKTKLQVAPKSITSKLTTTRFKKLASDPAKRQKLQTNIKK